MMQNTERGRLTPMDVPLIKLAPTRRLRLSLLATKLAIVELLWSRAHIYLLEVQQKTSDSGFIHRLLWEHYKSTTIL